MHESGNGISRRRFLGVGSKVALGAVAGTGGLALPVLGAVRSEPAGGTNGHLAILFDSTLCVGCRACEMACNDANQLGRSVEEIFAGREAEDFHALAPDVFTYITPHMDPTGSRAVAFGKAQCMHCLEPACATVCPVGALEKTPEGPVIWHGELCLGCRYCQMACPFHVPRFEWHSRNPRIRKCEMCPSRRAEGEKPACVSICPTGALKFGTREDLLAEAHRRIQENPRGYVHRVYGEKEAGGTGFLVLAAQPFRHLGYPEGLPQTSAAQAVRPAMAAVPVVLNGLILALGASAWVVHRRASKAEGENDGKEESHV